MDNDTTLQLGSSSHQHALQAELDQTKAELARLQIESESELNASNARFIELESRLVLQADQRTQLDKSLQEIQILKNKLEKRLEHDQHVQLQLKNLQSEKADLLQVIRDKEKEFSEIEGNPTHHTIIIFTLW